MTELNITKLASNLSGKERAKMMVLDLDKKLITGEPTLTDKEIDTLKTFENPKDLYEYNFYMNFREMGMHFIALSIENSVLKFTTCFLVLVAQSLDVPGFNKINFKEIAEGMQNHLNTAHSYKELALKMTNEFDFPVLGDYTQKQIEDDFSTLEFFKKMANHIFSLDADGELILKDAEIDNEMIDEIIRILERKDPKNVL